MVSGLEMTNIVFAWQNKYLQDSMPVFSLVYPEEGSIAETSVKILIAAERP